MSAKKLYLGNTLLNSENKDVKGEFVEIANEQYYKISNYNKIKDFFISVISNTDHWMFISSNGSLSAGRKNRDNALFPYYTEDKIHDYKGLTGSYSCFIIEKNNKNYLWEPFTSNTEKIYSVDRNIYKNFYGNKIIFEEINHDLELSFQYGWYNSEKYGFIKKSQIINQSNTNRKIQILDGIRNILPAGSDYNFQNEYSNLLDAYKKNELIEESKIGLFTLSSIPVDRAEPSESLFATTVWSIGINKPSILLSNNQIDEFKKGNSIKTEIDIRARRGTYYIHSEINLQKHEEKKWMIIAEINQDSADVSNLNQFILKTENIEQEINYDIDKGTESLKNIASNADGMQLTDTTLCYARHYSNTVYNIMRGGIFANNYNIEIEDYKTYLWQINKLVSKEFYNWFSQIPETINYSDLIDIVERTNNKDLLRITYEYLPITFSRRHGDPSRPWNLFSIETKNDDGSVKYNYEGNWRDIFQNWEALSLSYPEFIEGIISKFVNASTADGYNPYRIKRSGIDWECPDPNDPWAYIGYWGDHQIIYLQKLLELSNNFHPGKLDDLLVKEIFTYANVPYQIKPFEEIIQNPKDTIHFNEELNFKIKSEVEYLGADASLLKENKNSEIYKVNLTEKILVTLLAKLTNFIPEAGIWLNTQRPEWNDANNALVGNGVSMVTLYYLRRFLKFWEDKFSAVTISEIRISDNVATLFENVSSFLEDNVDSIKSGITDKERLNFAKKLGRAHSKYRNEIYLYSFSGEKILVQIKELKEFISLCLKYIDHSIRNNEREDGLYHAYNLISIKSDKISIRHLYEMLEGQVAVLSAGLLTTQENLKVLDSLKESKMFRSDQYSYMLYPDRQLPKFVEKNRIPTDKVVESKLLSKLLNDNNNKIIKTDDIGNFYFNKDFRNAEILNQALDNLRSEGYNHLVEEEKKKILDIYENVFDHQSFTGRSGTFYGYEGLGSIYWHMVSKLLLATQECYFKAVSENADTDILGRLKNHYYEIKAGIGLYKSPELYGAFPTDAYSHTPGNAGVKQPGLTGQVKEDVISRIGELGIHIKNGEVRFDISLLNCDEILKEDKDFEYYNIDGKKESVQIKKGELALTFCQILIIYKKSADNLIIIHYKNKSDKTFKGKLINSEVSNEIFKRNGEIRLIEVFAKDL